jgi:hypothetical protein
MDPYDPYGFNNVVRLPRFCACCIFVQMLDFCAEKSVLYGQVMEEFNAGICLDFRALLCNVEISAAARAIL